MKDSGTEFFVENNENKHEDQNEEDNLMDKLWSTSRYRTRI